MTKVFIDGSNGTTGLRLRDRLSEREDVELLSLPENLRKDTEARKEMLNESDVAFLCLPDGAAREAVSLVCNEKTVVIDASTAHRTERGWAYGFPELSPEFENRIREGKRIAVPGCHASGFIALVYPLIKAGIIGKDAELCCFSETGYSGGGKSMIKDYTSPLREKGLSSPRQYALNQKHKHLKEMTFIPGLDSSPVFCPVVSDFYSGMVVTVPLFGNAINGDRNGIISVYSELYRNGIVDFKPELPGKMIDANALSCRDGMEIFVGGNDERILLIARYDNLGKGASGAAVECLNLVTGQSPGTGLVI